MHMNLPPEKENLTVEYNSSISARGPMIMNTVIIVANSSTMWPRFFRRRGRARARGLRGGWSVDGSAMQG